MVVLRRRCGRSLLTIATTCLGATTRGRRMTSGWFIPAGRTISTKWLKRSMSIAGKRKCFTALKTKLRSAPVAVRRVIAIPASGSYLFTARAMRLRNANTNFGGAVRKWLNRRSQKRSMGWEKFNDYLAHYPLPKPSIQHNFYTGYPCVVR